MPELYPLLIILGPTAAGKTRLSIDLARSLNGEIISADSMQIYQGMDIGTAKVSLEEQKGVKHHLLDIISPKEEFSVADYQARVDKLIPQIVGRGKLPIMVGGTGLYIKSVVEGFLFPEMEANQQLREELYQDADKYGNQDLHQKLSEIDPEMAAKLHPNDLRRVVRAIEIFRQTGQTLSYYKKQQELKPDRYHSLKIGITREREELYQRINQRVDLMIKEGLLKEVKDLLSAGYQISSTALQGLGYKEIIGYLNEDYELQEAIRILKRDTRHYAKRQLTWFRRDKSIQWFNLSRTPYQVIKEKIIKIVMKSFLIRD